jgi:hypothetical protein
MASVVYVPKDTRWDGLGAGLGALIGNAVTGYQEAQVNQGVSQIQSDNSFPDQAAKTNAIMKKFGAQGITALTNQLKTDALQAQIGAYGAETESNKAKTAKTILDTEVEKTNAPQTLARLKAETAETQARTGLLGAQTSETSALTGPRKDLLINQGAEALTRSKEGEQSIEKTSTETDILKAQLASVQRLSQPGAVAADLAAQGITDPKEIAFAQSELSNKGLTGYNTAIKDIHDRTAKATEGKFLPSDIRKEVTTAAGQLPNLEPFLQPPPPGTPSGFGAGIAATLAKHGIGESDPELLRRATAAEQSVGQFASGGSGFGGSWRVKLAEQVTPQVQHSPLFNVISVGQLAKITSSELQSRLDEAKNVKGVDTSVIQDTLDKYRALEKKADSIWWTSPTDAQGKPIGDGKIHYYYGNDEVDKNLQTIRKDALLPAKQSYTYKGATYTGDQLNYQARQLGVDPQLYIRANGITPSGGQ